MKSEIEIVNLALAASGATKLLSGELATAQGAEAVFARTFYPQRRDELLEAFPWFFAKRRAVLAELAEVVRTDWTRVYQAPADMRTARFVVRPGIRNPGPEDSVPFALEAGDPATDDEAAEPGPTVLLCDLPNAELVYTANVTAPPRFSALFTSALGERLAIDFATYLTKKGDLANAAAARFRDVLGTAQTHSANQGGRDRPRPPDFLEGYEGDELVPSRFRFGVP